MHTVTKVNLNIKSIRVVIWSKFNSIRHTGSIAISGVGS